MALKQFDPSGTGLLVRGLTKDLQARFSKLKRALLRLVVEEDAFDLASGKPAAGAPTLNKRFRFATSAEKMKGFESWLDGQIKAEILSEDGSGDGVVTGTKYIRSAYKDALVSTYRATHKGGKAGKAFEGSQNQFLKDTFQASEAQSKLALLSTRMYSSLKDISSTMDAKMSRILAQGIADGKNPREVGRQMAKEVDDMSKVRAARIARTEMVHTHAEGQLDGFEALQVEGIEVMAEWLVTPDKRLCPKCAELSGVVLTIKEARGLLPRHPNCRCAFMPADVGESKKGQIRSKAGKTAAIERSVRMERPNADPAQAFKLSRWLGADLKPVAPPKSLESLPMFAPSEALWGQQPTAVMRWMGKEGWTPKEAARVLKEMGVDTADATISIQVNAGKKGLRGAAAALSDEQAAILRAKRIGPVVQPPPIKPPVITPPLPPVPPPIAPVIVPPPIIPPVIVPIAPPLPPIVPPPIPPLPPTGGLVAIPEIKQPATSIARWLGKEGFNFQDSKKIVEEMGLKVSDATLKTQLSAGAKGLRGPAATLTESQAAALRMRKGYSLQPGQVVRPPVIRVPKVPKVKPPTIVPDKTRMLPPKAPAYFEGHRVLEIVDNNQELNEIMDGVNEILEPASALEKLNTELLAEIEKQRAPYFAWKRSPERLNGPLMPINTQPIEMEYFRVIREQREAEAKLRELRLKASAQIHKLLELPEEERMSFKLKESKDYAKKLHYTNGMVKDGPKEFKAPTAVYREKLDTATKFLEKVTRKTGRVGGDAATLELQTKMFSRSASRAYYQANAVHMTEADDTRVFVHEMLHHYEYAVPGVKARSFAFLDARVRAAGTADQSMKKLFKGGYSAEEMGNEDDFGKYWGKGDSSAFYAGKRYADRSSEIISMAGQELYRDPAGLAAKDPQLFKFIVGVLRGSF